MITNSDLGLNKDTESVASTVEIDEIKEETITTTPGGDNDKDENTPSATTKIKDEKDTINVSRPSVPMNDNNNTSQWTQDDDGNDGIMEIITASQVDAIRSNQLYSSNDRDTTPTHTQLQFASLGLTQDSQIQDIVQQMDEMRSKYKQYNNNNNNKNKPDDK
eukprot:CAMPEP_0201570766 /NCGR_PEP_ID=MMETSP0190_2-20130828/13162_1 /ASSEMBLY_ACC=CAM_ASM_000263 /TAXON_ID=37353 /ORGANISM="Rosalina sp." /LENGTH=161 /DNA_ID=CAMNT_0047994653 /DNA_START=1612 /DNA_END=2097 /DNA_ORIENTATION=+